MSTQKENPAKIVTGKGVRFCYVHTAKPYAMDEGDPEKYSVCLLIPKKNKAMVKAIEAAIKAAAEAGKASKFDGKIPRNYKSPLRDGDEERDDKEEFEGMYFINAKSNRKPQILDQFGHEILDAEEFYSGCYGRASIQFYAYNAKGSKGVACALNACLKLEDGEPLGGGSTNARSDFGFEEEEEDDDLG